MTKRAWPPTDAEVLEWWDAGGRARSDEDWKAEHPKPTGSEQKWRVDELLIHRRAERLARQRGDPQ